MYSIVFAHTPESYDQLIEELWAAGTAGVIEGATTVEAFFDDPDALARLAHWNPLKASQAEEVDWEKYTKDSFPPSEVGARFFLAPPWCEDPTPPGRIRLVINPGLACGTGYHPCTRLCLTALEQFIKPGMRLFDAGAGSGILSIAASHLGAHPFACDIDPDAIPYCETPLKFIGSADAARTAAFDAVVANISAPVNHALWPEYQRIVRPGGAIILSGFEEFEPPAEPVARLAEDAWLCYVFERT